MTPVRLSKARLGLRSRRPNIYLRDTKAGTTVRVSRRPAVDAAGRVLIFSSRHPIDDRDIEHDDDLFVQVRAAPRATSR